MNQPNPDQKFRLDDRIVSVLSFSLLFGYLLAFVFEGQVLYRIMAHFQIKAIPFIFASIIAHFFGLLASGVLFAPFFGARKTMLFGIFTAIAATLPFFFLPHPIVWLTALIASAFGCGLAVAAWGYYLKACTPRNQRYKTAADVLIYSNIIMLAANGLATYLNPVAGLAMCLLAILSAMYFTWRLPDDLQMADNPKLLPGNRSVSLVKPVMILIVFILILTINSGFMYQVVAPAYDQIEWLSGWYWALPYIIALIVIRHLLQRGSRPHLLYVGVALLMLSFLFFQLPVHDAWSYLLVDTPMLGACGIFDLFWWSIIGEILEYSRNTVRTAGVCISANVLGVLLGGLLGQVISTAGISVSHVTVTIIALVIICITTALLPLLNMFLVGILKNHVYLYAFSGTPGNYRTDIIEQDHALAPLSAREKEVLALILTARTNRGIAAALHISEDTVKTHIKNIYGKYDVASRAELITLVLKNQADVTIG